LIGKEIMNAAITKITALLISFAAFNSVCVAQENLKNAFGQSPPIELKKFEPFLGKYEATVDWPNLKWSGTLELAYDIKGWFVESNLIKETAGPHRHWRLLMTWDEHQKKYRVWRFETTPMRPNIEGVIRFEGNEMVAEWLQFPRADGKRVTYRSIFKIKNRDELEIITEDQDADGKVNRIGIVTTKRKT
jgi:hypothetical protein